MARTWTPSRCSSGARTPPRPASGWLMGWRLTFGGEDMGWDGALPMIVPDPDAQVFVALYEISPPDLKVLDYWEGADTGLYNRIRLRVSTLEADVLAWVYLLDGFEGGLPSARTIGLISAAAEAVGAPDEYVADVRSRECRRWASDGVPERRCWLGAVHGPLDVGPLGFVDQQRVVAAGGTTTRC